jgi:hypothetical protein
MLKKPSRMGYAVLIAGLACRQGVRPSPNQSLIGLFFIDIRFENATIAYLLFRPPWRFRFRP